MASSTLSDTWIKRRRTAYSCCAAEYFLAAVQALSVGDEECYKENRRLGRLMKYAYDVMCGTATSTEDANVRCVTHEEACEVAQKADPLCVECGCTSETTASGSPPVDCTIVADSVTAFLDISEIGPPPPGTPQAGDIYLVVSDGGSSFTAIQAEWDGASYINIISPVPDGSVYYDGSTYMVVPPQPPGWPLGMAYALFPTITVTYTGITGSYSVVSDAPLVSMTQGRTIQIEASQDGGSTWVVVSTMAEDQIAMAITINTLPGIISPTDFRIHYYTADCDYGYQDATLNTTPPFNYVWMGTGSAPTDTYLYRGALEGPVPFTLVDTIVGTGSDRVGMIRRDFSSQGSGNVVAVGMGVPNTNVALRSSNDEGATWAEPGGDWKTSPHPSGIQIGQTVSWATGIGAGDVCIVAGNPKSLFMSTDGGSTFDYLPQNSGLELASEEIKCAVCRTSSEYIVGTRRSIWLTSDGGATYTKTLNIFTTMPGADLLYLQIASDVVLAFFDTGVRRSSDGGTTWGPLDTSLILSDVGMGLTDCYPRQDQVGGVGQRIMAQGSYSDDYGLTWNTPPSGWDTLIHPVGLTHDMWLCEVFTQGHYLYTISTQTVTLLYPLFPNGPTGNDPVWCVDAKIFP